MNPRILALAALLAAPVPASTEAYTAVDADQSRIAFGFRPMGVSMQGRFESFRAELDFDPARPESASATLEIELESFDAGVRDLNREVHGSQWFDTANHPVARFVSSSVTPLGEGRYELAGELTLKGTTRPLRTPVTISIADGHALFEGEFVLERLDHDIGTGAWRDTRVVANEVQVRFSLAALQPTE